MGKSMRQRNLSISLVLLIALTTFTLGALVTNMWIKRVGGIAGLGEAGGANWPLVIGCVLLVAVFTLTNLMIRWLRWHFLLRKLNLMLRTKDSFFTYMAALPFLITPFSVGELVRILMLRKSYPGSGGRIFMTWLLERVSDLLVLSVFIFAAMNRWDLLAMALIAWAIAVSAWVGMLVQWSGPKDAAKPLRVISQLMILTAVSWALPGVALAWIIKIMGDSAGLLYSLGLYAYSTVLGGLSSAPLGVGVTGSIMVESLVAHGISMDHSIIETIVFRVGTTYFAVGFGIFVTIVFFRQIKEIIYTPSGTSHFDEIAADYQGQIPSHIVDRLIDRKSALMHTILDEMNIPAHARGFDLGCGQGFYATRMAELGYMMTGIDASTGQVEHARRYAADKGVKVEFKHADANVLPFESEQYDFAYAINIFHHIKGARDKSAAIEEIMRVLKPGGVFFLHEINTHNPWFRFYMNYVFPLLRTIDEGDEEWVMHDDPPRCHPALMPPEVRYFTFLPDFLPEFLLAPLVGLEKMLERSHFKHYSAHFMVIYKKTGDK